MQLDEAKRQKVAGWIAEGAKLSDIQSRLASEFAIKMTYMEVRFLVDDLKLVPKDPEPPAVFTPQAVAPAAPATPAAPGDAKSAALPVEPPLAPPLGGPGSVSVIVDQITRPGSIVSGKVTFSDGQLADWYLDQSGRLGVVPKVQGYKPAAADVQQFQLALEKEVTKLGYI
jgi:hypothetical protein